MADPYYQAQDEIQENVRRLSAMYEDWKIIFNKENTAKSRRFQDLHSELLGDLRMIGQDVQDIEQSVDAVKQMRDRFPTINDAELHDREAFVRRVKQSINEIREKVTSKETQAKLERHKQEASSDQDAVRRRRIENENEAFLRNTQSQQQQLVRQQDEQLNELSVVAERLGQTASIINVELEDQQRMLSELDRDMDREAEKLNFVMKRMGKLLQTNDHKQLCLIAILFAIFSALFLINVTL
mmetsp:Transcript_27647/g.66916  ORF Transcript_27647/g.66916 Transcript_27647/m.66916 type:complete len:241 (-) Transcript_27647:66-788(-)